MSGWPLPLPTHGLGAEAQRGTIHYAAAQLTSPIQQSPGQLLGTTVCANTLVEQLTHIGPLLLSIYSLPTFTAIIDSSTDSTVSYHIATFLGASRISSPHCFGLH